MLEAHTGNPQHDRKHADQLSRGKQVERNLLLLIAVIVVGTLIPFAASLSWHARIVILIKVVIVMVGLLAFAQYLVYSIKKEQRKKAQHGPQSRPID